MLNKHLNLLEDDNFKYLHHTCPWSIGTAVTLFKMFLSNCILHQRPNFRFTLKTSLYALGNIFKHRRLPKRQLSESNYFLSRKSFESPGKTTKKPRKLKCANSRLSWEMPKLKFHADSGAKGDLSPVRQVFAAYFFLVFSFQSTETEGGTTPHK